MLIIIDYNVGNVKSVANAFHHIGCEAKLSCNPADIENAGGLVLPGVAAWRWWRIARSVWAVPTADANSVPSGTWGSTVSRSTR